MNGEGVSACWLVVLVVFGLVLVSFMMFCFVCVFFVRFSRVLLVFLNFLFSSFTTVYFFSFFSFFVLLFFLSFACDSLLFCFFSFTSFNFIVSLYHHPLSLSLSHSCSLSLCPSHCHILSFVSSFHLRKNGRKGDARRLC